MKLDRYNDMRDFAVTAEPTGRVKRSRTGSSFVVQKHAATALHYDFRLELDGVLLSWAVPKGPSLDPRDKRLAVQTEDHPVDYRDFEGTIPKGEYGGGPVIVWDRGTWEPVGDPHEGLKRGRLEFSLDGEKLHGRFLLVRTRIVGKKQQWLLMKRSDEHASATDGLLVRERPESVLTGRTIDDVRRGKPARAPDGARPAKMPAFGKVKPQLATLVTDVPTSGDWVYELKYDGYRALAWLDHGRVRLSSRSGKEWTGSFPAIEDALSRLRATTAVFDGEIAFVEDDGRTDFQKLVAVLGSPARQQRLVFFVFDLLYYDGVDLRSSTLRERKELLRTILAGEGPPLKLGDHLDGNGEALYEHACKAGLEGILAKRADRPYREGRAPEWVKVKCQKRQELVIAGFTPPKGSRSGLGALLLAVREKGGFRYAGKVGTGFSQASLAELRERLAPLAVDAPAAQGAPTIKGATWVKPELVCQVRFTEWTRDGRLRHPAFEGLRVDKPARVVHREVEAPMVGGVAVSNAQRVVDPKSGITKGEVARYHAAVAEAELPYLAKRPLMLLRCPSGGIGSRPCFVQKRLVQGTNDHVEKGKAFGNEIVYVEELEGIFELVQNNVIELHGAGARMPRFDRPDWAIFDLDPDEALPFSAVVEAAREVRDVLSTLDLSSFVKTTGGKGLHVVVPLSPVHDTATVRAFTEGIARVLAARSPDQYVATMSKKARTGKIFVDWLRNGEGATAVLPYSPRARPGLTVAMPVAWKELSKVHPQELDVRTVPPLLARRRVDPWAELLGTRQRISKRVLASLDR
jgi:bifunctional non-homologous end joining protein LigD